MPNPTEVHNAVRDHYGAIARAQSSSAGCCGTADVSSSCCAPALYDVTLLDKLPTDVTNLSLGCGDPVSLAGLNPGEKVLDLGSGGGIDCFMAALAVGPAGGVIGVDMTPDMIEKARANAGKIKFDASNVEFRLGQIEALPVEDDSVDVILSNCVINLSPDKASVFREAYRVLKPGGRVSISDIVTIGDFVGELKNNLNQWAACVTGAVDIQEYVGLMKQAGFTEIEVVDKVTAGSLLVAGVQVPRILSARITARKS